MGSIISAIVDIINFIISAIVDINNFDTVDFDAGEDDWGLEEPAPFFDLDLGFYLEAGVHYADYNIAGFNIVDRVHG